MPTIIIVYSYLYLQLYIQLFICIQLFIYIVIYIYSYYLFLHTTLLFLLPRGETRWIWREYERQVSGFESWPEATCQLYGTGKIMEFPCLISIYETRLPYLTSRSVIRHRKKSKVQICSYKIVKVQNRKIVNNLNI